jgi:hypothetical protein
MMKRGRDPGEVFVAARAVLADARVARQRAAERMAANENHRPEWFAAVGLLRTVNDVLRRSVKNSDDPIIKRVVAEKWASVNSDPGSIFGQVMKAERNNVLHEYVFGTHAPSYLLTEDGGRIELEDGSGFLLIEEPNLDYIDSALAWWEETLNELQATIRRERGKP